MPARPVLRCLVARFVVGGFCSLPQIVTLHQAEYLHSLDCGWAVLVDPADEIDLATWEREQIPFNTPRQREA